MGVAKAVTNTSNLLQTSAQAISKQKFTYYSLGTLELLIFILNFRRTRNRRIS